MKKHLIYLLLTVTLLFLIAGCTNVSQTEEKASVNIILKGVIEKLSSTRSFESQIYWDQLSVRIKNSSEVEVFYGIFPKGVSIKIDKYLPLGNYTFRIEAVQNTYPVKNIFYGESTQYLANGTNNVPINTIFFEGKINFIRDFQVIEGTSYTAKMKIVTNMGNIITKEIDVTPEVVNDIALYPGTWEIDLEVSKDGNTGHAYFEGIEVFPDETRELVLNDENGNLSIIINNKTYILPYVPEAKKLAAQIEQNEGGTGIRLTWEYTGGGEVSYHLYRNKVKIAEVSETVFIDYETDIIPGKTYEYGIVVLRSDLINDQIIRKESGMTKINFETPWLLQRQNAIVSRNNNDIIILGGELGGTPIMMIDTLSIVSNQPPKMIITRDSIPWDNYVADPVIEITSDKILLLGGLKNGDYTNIVQEFDKASHTWSSYPAVHNYDNQAVNMFGTYYRYVYSQYGEFIIGEGYIYGYDRQTGLALIIETYDDNSANMTAFSKDNYLYVLTSSKVHRYNLTNGFYHEDFPQLENVFYVSPHTYAKLYNDDILLIDMDGKKAAYFYEELLPRVFIEPRPLNIPGAVNMAFDKSTFTVFGGYDYSLGYINNVFGFNDVINKFYPIYPYPELPAVD